MEFEQWLKLLIPVVCADRERESALAIAIATHGITSHNYSPAKVHICANTCKMLGAGSIFPPKEENIPPPTQHLSFGGNQNTVNIRPWTGNVRSQFVTAIFTTEISPWRNGFTIVHTSSLFGVFGLVFLNGKCINYLVSKLVNVVARSIPSRRLTYPFHGGAGSFRWRWLK